MTQDWDKYIVQEEEEPESKWDQFVVEPEISETGEPKEDSLTEGREKTFKSYMKDWFKKIGGAALKVPEQFMEGVKYTEEHLYDAPGEFVRFGLEKAGVSKETAEAIGEFTKGIKYTRPDYWGMRLSDKVNDAVRDTEAFKSLSEEAEKLHKESIRYDETITELLKEKDFGGAFGAIMLAGAESLPLSMIAAFGGPAGLATLGVVAGAEKYDELSERDDMDEAVKLGVSIAIGGLEAATEMMGTAKIGGLVKNAWKGAGKEATEATVKAGLNAWFRGMYKKAGIYFAPVQEGIEEGVNAIGGNIVARLSGEDPEREMSEGVLDSFLGGMGGGTYFTAAGGMGKAVNDIKKRFKGEIKPEEKVAPGAAKEPVGDKEKIPEVPKEQPLVPKYKIGEQVFDTKEEFIAEVETYKGKEDTPKITVTDDQATLDEVDQILTIKEEPSHAESVASKVKKLREEQELDKTEEERLRLRDIEQSGEIQEEKAPTEEVPEEINRKNVDILKDRHRVRFDKEPISLPETLLEQEQERYNEMSATTKETSVDARFLRENILSMEEYIAERKESEGKPSTISERVTKLEGAKDNLNPKTRTFLGQLNERGQQIVGWTEHKEGSEISGITDKGAAKLKKLGEGVEFEFYNPDTKVTTKYYVEGDPTKIIEHVERVSGEKIRGVEGKPPPDSPDYPKWVTEKSNDIDEIAGAHTRLKEEGEQTLAPWQEDALTQKVNPESFDKVMDPNLRKDLPIMGKHWFDIKRDKYKGYDKGYEMDQIAQELSLTYGVEVTPQMLGDFMVQNQDKRTGAQKGLIRRLEQKYKRLTGDNIADYGKATEEESTLEKLQDISSLDELFNEDGSLNVDVTNDKIDNDPDFFKGFRVDFTDEEIAELKNIINDDTRRKEFEDAIKATRSIQEQIIGKTVEPSEEGDVGEVTEEESGDVSELASRASEITKSFGLSGFRTTEGQEGTRSELAKEDITNWLNKEEQIELRKAKDEKAKAEVSKKFNEQRELISKAKARDEGAVRSILHDFLQRNRKALGAIHGRAVPTIISRVNDKATTFVQLANIMEYINDTFASEAQKQKKITVGKIIEEADPAKKLEVKKGAKRAKSAYLNRLTDENIKQSEAITEQIERMDPMAVEEEIKEIEDKIATLQESHGDPKNKSGEIDYSKAIDALEDQRDILEFGRIWEMSQTELDRALAEMQRINKVGRSQAKQGRIARAMKGARMRTALNNIIGHPAFRRGASQLKKKGFFKRHFTTFDVDFPALLNQMERIVGKNFKWQWDNALSADNRFDINTKKLGKH